VAQIPPASDTGLRDFCTNFDLVATPIATAIGLTAAQMLAFHGLSLDYNARLAAAIDPSTRTKVTIEQKRVSKASILAAVRQLMKIVDAFPGTTNPQRASLGMRVKDVSPSPRPAPSTQPVVAVAGTGGGLAVLRLRDETTPDKKAKPAGVFGALLSTAVTTADAPAPTFPADTFNAVITRTTHTMTLPLNSAGKRLWVQAQWINERGEPGPTSLVANALIAA
jgi:hypothetical protein